MPSWLQPNAVLTVVFADLLRKLTGREPSMPIQLIRDDSGREVYRVETPSGVVGYVAAQVSDEALVKLIAKRYRAPRTGGDCDSRPSRQRVAAADPPWRLQLTT
jgi:hypothetical protein